MPADYIWIPEDAEKCANRQHAYAEWRAMSEEARQKWLNIDCDYMGYRALMKPEEYFWWKKYGLDA